MCREHGLKIKKVATARFVTIMSSATCGLLSNINAATVKICSYQVRVLQPEIEKYTYSAQAPKPLQDFRCYLVGSSPSDYMPAIVRGQAKAQAALQTFKDQSVWTLTTCCLDSKMTSQYISGPIKCCMHLAPPTKATPLDEEHAKTLATYMLPKYNVAA